MRYDYLIVGAGLFGAVFAHQAQARGRRCLVVERRPHLGGNAYTEEVDGVMVHRYGAHIFHTGDERVWRFVSGLARFNHFVNSPLARAGGRLYSLPFNMNTFYQLWGVTTPDEARARIAAQRAAAGAARPRNLEEQAISLVGEDLYRLLIKGYTEKQWGRDCRDLPPDIIRRLPVRFRYDNNYFNDPWQGIPEEGYTALVGRLLERVETRLDTDFLACRGELMGLADRVIYTGPVDAYFDYRLGALAYRSLRFETETLGRDSFQGVAVVNYCDREVPWTRIIEHKHFVFGEQPVTVISREYPREWAVGDEPYYPVNDRANQELLARYQELAAREPRVIFGGRLGSYRYYDMDRVVGAALELSERELAP